MINEVSDIHRGHKGSGREEHSCRERLAVLIELELEVAHLVVLLKLGSGSVGGPGPAVVTGAGDDQVLCITRVQLPLGHKVVLGVGLGDGRVVPVLLRVGGRRLEASTPEVGDNARVLTLEQHHVGVHHAGAERHREPSVRRKIIDGSLQVEGIRIDGDVELGTVLVRVE